MRRYLKSLFLLAILLFAPAYAHAAGEIKTTDTSGKTVYAVILNQSALAWNGSTFATVANANWSTYPVLLSEQGTTGIYVATFPAGITTPGRYSELIYERAGGSAAVGDTLIAQGTLDWDGAALALPLSQGQLINTSSAAGTIGEALYYDDLVVGRRGTAQGGTSNTIQLDAGASATDGIFNTHFVKIVSGTGAGQFATISSYVGATKVATISRPGPGTWTTIPDSTSVFLIWPQPMVTLAAGQSTIASNFVAAPTAAQNRAEMDLNSTQLALLVTQTASIPTAVANANAVWSNVVRSLTTQADSPGVTTLLTTTTGIKSKTDLIATNSADSPNAVTAQGNAASTNSRVATGIPNIAPGAAGGLPTGDGSGRVLLQPSQPGVTIPTVTGLTNPVVASGVTGDVGGKVLGGGSSTITGDGVRASSVSTGVQVASYATGQDPATLLLLIPANKIATNGSGFVTATNGGGGGSDPWASLTSAYTTPGTMGYYQTHTLSTYAGADTSGTTTLLNRIPAFPANFSALAIDSSGNMTVGTLSSSALAAIQLAVWNKVVDGSVTAWDDMVLLTASIIGAGGNSFNGSTHTLVSTRKRQDGTTNAYATALVLANTAPAPNPQSATITVTTPLH
ncbi:hypothetical protein CCAX7_54340 [Capsulimonas corticalis]|uniref:Uncharacterized protein n=1 Tax=Capsulimonas corticalis TaxID=2219043 RepID=A0A402CNB8_9BACT|nr:hypothetical protein [Capsulimonas corticalis]BDI33383.1 hypothetical protein CCAX7_54340 [Capsulimonas corticalis]